MWVDTSLSVLSVWITYSVQVLFAYLITRVICAVIRSPRRRLHIWGWFLFLAVFRWIYLCTSASWNHSNHFADATVSLPDKYTLHQSLSIDRVWALHLGWPAKWAWPVYLAIVVLLLLQLLLKSLRLRGLLRSSLSPSPVLQLRFQRICGKMKVNRCKLLLVPELRSPAACGLWRENVLLPADLVSELNTAQLSHIMRHELTHIRQRDYLWDRLAALACRVVFFHPTLWIAHRRLRWDRELACDQTVLENSGQERLQYAECLVKLARWSYLTSTTYADGIGFSSPASLLTTRVNAVLCEPRPYSALQRALRVSLVAGLLIIGALLLPACGLTLSWRLPLVSPQAPSLTAHKGARKGAGRLKAATQRTLMPEPVLSTESVNRSESVNLFAGYRTPVPPILESPSNPESSSLEPTSEEKHDATGDVNLVWDESQAPGPGTRSINWRKLAINTAAAAVVGIASREHPDRDDARSHFH